MSESLYIGGQWRAGKAEVLTSEDPSTGEQIWRGTTADEDDVAAAVAAARRAFEAWRRRPIHERFEAVREFRDEVRRRSDEVAEVIARETGKPLWEVPNITPIKLPRGFDRPHANAPARRRLGLRRLRPDLRA